MAEPPIETRFCVNCKKDISSTNYQMHEMHCKRFMTLCEKCDEAVLKDSIDDHNNEFHAEVQCDQCDKKISKDNLFHHQEEDCTHRRLLCEFCDLDYPQHEFKLHQDDCGSRTDNCEICSTTVLLRNMKKHLSSSCSRYSTKSDTANKSMGDASMYQNQPARLAFSRQPLLPKIPNSQAYEARIRSDSLKSSPQDSSVYNQMDKHSANQSSSDRTRRTNASSGMSYMSQHQATSRIHASTGQKKQTNFVTSNNLPDQSSSNGSSFSGQVNTASQSNSEMKKFPAASNSLKRSSQNKQLTRNQFLSSGSYKDSSSRHVSENSSIQNDRASLLTARGDGSKFQRFPGHSHSPRHVKSSRSHGDYFSRDGSSSHGKSFLHDQSSYRGRGGDRSSCGRNGNMSGGHDGSMSYGRGGSSAREGTEEYSDTLSHGRGGRHGRNSSFRGGGDSSSRGRGDSLSRLRGGSMSGGHGDSSSRGRGDSSFRGRGSSMSRGGGDNFSHKHGGSSAREYSDTLSRGSGGRHGRISNTQGNSLSCSDDDLAFVPCEFCDNPFELKELERHQAVCDKNYITQFDKTTLQSRYQTPSPVFQRSVNSSAADAVPCEHCGSQISFDELVVHQSACYMNHPVNNEYEEGSLMHQFEFTSCADEMMCENCKQMYSSPDELFAHQIECLEAFDHPILSNITPQETRNCFSSRLRPESHKDVQPVVTFPEDDDDDLLPCEFCHNSFPVSALVQHQYTCEENNVTSTPRR